MRDDVVVQHAEVQPAFEGFLADLSAALAVVEAEDLEREIAGWLDRLAQELGAERCTVGEFYVGDEMPRFLLQWEAGKEPEPFMPEARAWIQGQLSSGRVLAFPSLDEMPAEADAAKRELEEMGIRCGLWIPMLVEGQTVGAFGLTVQSHERPWPAHVIQRCRLVADVFGNALVRRRKGREIEELSSFEMLVTDISARLMNAEGDIDTLTDQIIKELGEFLGADRISFIEIDTGEKRLSLTRQWVASGLPDEDSLGDFQIVPHTNVASRFQWLAKKMFANEPVAVVELDKFPVEAMNEREYCEFLGVQSFTVVPASLRGSVVAALALDNIRVLHQCGERVLQRLQIVASLIASAQARARAQHELDEMRRFENAISRISTAFVNLAPEAVDEKIEGGLEVVAKALDVDLITLLQPQGKTGYVVTHEWAADVSRGEGFKGANVDDYPWLAGHLSRGEAVSISALSEFPAEAVIERTAMDREGLESVLWVPFEIRGELAGHLAVNTVRERSWSEELVPQLRLLGEIFGEALNRRDAELKLQQSFKEIEALKEELQQENLYLREEAKLTQRYGDIVGDSAPLRAVLAKAEQVAPTDSTVLLLGETGTGKELLARAIHNNSSRKDQVMVKVNCAALPSSLVEAELFGREKGAYTGALTRELGRFEIADGSTILLDEIGELSPELQAKLLRVLQDGEFERLGSSKTVKVDVRVLAATNRDLTKAVEEKEFREDLYYRLNVFPIELPPLRERVEDIPQLVWAFVQELAQTMGKTIETIPRTVMDALKGYSWPGNVREVRNLVERAMIVSRGSVLEIEVPHEAATPSESTASSRRLADVEREHIRAVLEATGWRIRGAGGAAEILGLKPTTLEARMKKLGLERSTTQ